MSQTINLLELSGKTRLADATKHLRVLLTVLQVLAICSSHTRREVLRIVKLFINAETKMTKFKNTERQRRVKALEDFAFHGAAARYNRALLTLRRNRSGIADMSTHKTHKGAAKRFRKTRRGKVKRWRSGKRHLLSCKTAKRRRNLRKSAICTSGDEKKLLKLLGS